MTEEVVAPPAEVPETLSRGLRQAGALIAAGLLVELVTLFWAHPTAFLTFAFVGGTLMAAGVARYLYTILKADSPPKGRTKRTSPAPEDGEESTGDASSVGTEA